MDKKSIEKKIIDLATKNANFREQLKKVTKTEKMTDQELQKVAGGLSDLLAAVNLNARDLAR